MKEIAIYWAGPCFTQAERIWNRICAKILRKKGYKVILPQDEAEKFRVNGEIDYFALAEHCYSQSIETIVMVAVLDGPDPDSGTSVEVGIKIGEIRASGRGKVLGVRTDFRRSEDERLNAMFRLLDDCLYFPSFNESCEQLCNEIDKRIKKLLPARAA